MAAPSKWVVWWSEVKVSGLPVNLLVSNLLLANPIRDLMFEVSKIIQNINQKKISENVIRWHRSGISSKGGGGQGPPQPSSPPHTQALLSVKVTAAWQFLKPSETGSYVERGAYRSSTQWLEVEKFRPKTTKLFAVWIYINIIPIHQTFTLLTSILFNFKFEKLLLIFGKIFEILVLV